MDLSTFCRFSFCMLARTLGMVDFCSLLGFFFSSLGNSERSKGKQARPLPPTHSIIELTVVILTQTLNALLQIKSESMTFHQIFVITRDLLFRKHNGANTTSFPHVGAFNRRSELRVRDHSSGTSLIWDEGLLLQISAFDGVNLSAIIFHFEKAAIKPGSHPCATKLPALVIPEKAQEKRPQ